MEGMLAREAQDILAPGDNRVRAPPPAGGDVAFRLQSQRKHRIRLYLCKPTPEGWQET
jgi:hypothetical protein